MDIEQCPVCGSQAEMKMDINTRFNFYLCDICGRFEYSPLFAGFEEFNYNHLSSYFFYNGFHSSGFEYRYFTTISSENCDKINDEVKKGQRMRKHPVHLSVDNVKAWYPKTISEKIDNILLYIANKTRFFGDVIELPFEASVSLLFVNRYNNKNLKQNEYKLTNEDLCTQIEYVLNLLQGNEWIASTSCVTEDGSGTIDFNLMPKGYSRVDELQKNVTNGKDVLVAMQFGNETLKLREAIRKGITDAGYIAKFIDEVEHNDFITPELLKHIKDSKFVVADLTHQNNGAYFEEGYAFGLGKQVIQLCREDVRLHFDIAQKNTILWKTEEEISERLKNRILATID